MDVRYLFDCYCVCVFEFSITCFDFVFSFFEVFDLDFSDSFFYWFFSNWIGSSHS